MTYRINTARALQHAHPDFWQRMQMEQLTQNPMLLGFWHVYLRQAERKGIDPQGAAAGFVKATTRPRVH